MRVENIKAKESQHESGKVSEVSETEIHNAARCTEKVN
jgi:hypothetical protein